MSTIEKLIKEMLTCPSDFREGDLDRVMKHFGHLRDNGSGGSGVKYFREKDGSQINFHLPHNSNSEKALPKYVIKQAIAELKKRGDIK